MRWYMYRVDGEDGEILYEAHEGDAKSGLEHVNGFATFEGANAKEYCSRFVAMMNGGSTKG